ncbi:MAG TPA: MtrAB system histidine kinase MtrB [Mycobacteriales bacterium]|nr:MtrAB system histidine kinase MtrB [Mycobacteriales bacterium]
MRTRWRRSLQIRVVGTTLLVSSIVVALFASLLLDQVGRGLVDAKVAAALTQAESDAQQLQVSLESATLPDQAAVETLLRAQVQTLLERGVTGRLYRVVLAGPPNAQSFSAPGLTPSDVPAELVAELEGGAPPAYVFADAPGPDGRAEALIAGSLIASRAGGVYRLYHFFPLTTERATLALVRRTVAVAGLLLVALLALIASLVARQVVTPVRLAALTAERLAAGRLEERMSVHGEDEIARLGSTFNAMATALQSQIGQLEDLSRVQQRFVADVSHELRTPLTTVRMAAEVLHGARSSYPPHVRRSAELLQGELDRFEELLVDLLEISRYDAGAASLEAEATDLGALVRRVVVAAAPLAERKGTVVDLSRLPREPVVAEVDPLRVERVLRNLVVNAIEHGEGLPVRIELGADDDAVAIAIRDGGVGLRSGEAALVFTRFWRADPSRARTSGGTGLGLAIAREDVLLHGGWLEAAGSPGGGASFRMTLPRLAGGVLTASPLRLEASE